MGSIASDMWHSIARSNFFAKNIELVEKSGFPSRAARFPSRDTSAEGEMCWRHIETEPSVSQQETTLRRQGGVLQHALSYDALWKAA